jgi:hypothetical protein
MKDEIILQMSVRKGQHDAVISVDIEPSNKRVLLAAMKFMAERATMTAKYLEENIETEELR